jgi:hypothetical protein
VPQREVFEDQGAVGPDPAEEADEDEGDHAGHHRSGRPKVNVEKVDGVSRRHRGSGTRPIGEGAALPHHPHLMRLGCRPQLHLLDEAPQQPFPIARRRGVRGLHLLEVLAELLRSLTLGVGQGPQQGIDCGLRSLLETQGAGDSVPKRVKPESAGDSGQQPSGPEERALKRLKQFMAQRSAKLTSRDEGSNKPELPEPPSASANRKKRTSKRSRKK